MLACRDLALGWMDLVVWLARPARGVDGLALTPYAVAHALYALAHALYALAHAPYALAHALYALAHATYALADAPYGGKCQNVWFFHVKRAVSR